MVYFLQHFLPVDMWQFCTCMRSSRVKHAADSAPASSNEGSVTIALPARAPNNSPDPFPDLGASQTVELPKQEDRGTITPPTRPTGESNHLYHIHPSPFFPPPSTQLAAARLAADTIDETKSDGSEYDDTNSAGGGSQVA